MKLDIIEHDLVLDQGMKNAIKNTMNELDQYFKDGEKTAYIIAKKYPHGYKMEVTIKISDDMNLRQDTLSSDIYQAIDLAGKKLERQIFKTRSRIKQKKATKLVYSDVNISADILHSVARRKSLKIDLVTEEEAVLQFELSGHDFYIYRDIDSSNTCVLYRRKDETYGLIEMI